MHSLFRNILLVVLIAAVSGSPTPCVTCDCCDSSLISISTSGSGAHTFEKDETNTESVCTKRILTCTGKNANIEVNKGGGSISNPATLTVTCNHGGTAWEVAGVAVTQLECSASK